MQLTTKLKEIPISNKLKHTISTPILMENTLILDIYLGKHVHIQKIFDNDKQGKVKLNNVRKLFNSEKKVMNYLKEKSLCPLSN